MKALLFAENFISPYDEGLKKVIYYLAKVLDKKLELLFISSQGHPEVRKNKSVITNKLLLNRDFFSNIKEFSPDITLYIPEASCTFNSFVRAKILKLMNKKSKVVMLAVQHRNFYFFYRMLLNFLRPDLLFLLSKTDVSFFEKKGIKVKILPPAIEREKFHKVDLEYKMELRKKYGLPLDKTIILHVGHIKRSRNLECFLEVQKIDSVQVVIVGSTTTQADKELTQLLEKQGVIVLNTYLADIQEIYQLSDIYVFPVLKQDAAIEMPLSVLEALACNLPVITTRFGGLVDYFKEDIGFRYFCTTEELVELIKRREGDEIHNDKKVEGFTWDRFTEEVITACEELV